MIDPDKTPLFWHRPYSPDICSAVCYVKSTLDFLSNEQKDKVINHTIRAGYTSKLVSKCGIIPIDLHSEFYPKTQIQADMLDTYSDLFLNSASNEYVVFDGTSKELFCGSLKRCVAWLNENKEYYPIYSREAYNEMLNKVV